jgi:hypothetical protein
VTQFSVKNATKCSIWEARAAFVHWHGTCLSISRETNSSFVTFDQKAEVILAIPQTTGKRPRKARSSVVSSAAAGASWMALLAVTSLGAVSVERMRAEVSAQDVAAATSAGYRLIVQSYSRDSVGADQLPGASHRPLASVQRSVTAEELARGVAVDVLQIDQVKGGAQVIVAWIEHGAPDLEFDALRARPSRGAVVGVAQASAGSAQIVLRRQEA